MNDDSIMPFGKHKGSRMKDIPADYLIWFMDQDWAIKYPQVLQYCKENKKALDEETCRAYSEYEDLYED